MTTKITSCPLAEWFPEIEKPLIVAGPCSAESREQVVNTALEIAKIPQVKIFRAGLWKPRTRPNSFEGVGEQGLEWLQEVKERTNLLITVEIATPQHADKCLKYKDLIDVFWIGARTTPNPFAIQELANALSGINIPVMVKNPMNPELALWLGALERFSMVGIKKLAAIHRGFYPFEKSLYRNLPRWEIPIELKRRFPDIPLICDPSHIAGLAALVPEVAQKALDLNFDGLMIESHTQPENALSDAAQQLTPAELFNTLAKLKYRKERDDDSECVNCLEKFRDEIDEIDEQLLQLLAKRMAVVERIGEYKKQNNITILQLRRWRNIIENRTAFGKRLGLSVEFTERLLQLVHKESINRQMQILDTSSEICDSE